MEYKRKYKMTKEDNIFFAKRNIVDYIWKSANLEHIGATYPDTQAIYNGLSVSGLSIDDINNINNLKHAWQELLSSIEEPLDLKYIKKCTLKLVVSLFQMREVLGSVQILA